MNFKKIIALTLSIIMIASCLPTMVASAQETAYGSSANTAISTELNKNYTFKWSYNDGTRTHYDLWLKVTTPRKGVLQFSGNKLIDASGEEDFFFFKMFKTSDTNAAFWQASSSRFQTQKSYSMEIPVDAGTYYFVVSGVYVYSNDPERTLKYSFKHTATGTYETEPNGNVNSANKLSFNNKINAINSSDDDVYAITVKEDTPARIKIGNFEAVKEAGTYIQIKFANGTSDYMYLSDYGAVKANGYYYDDFLLKKGTNLIIVSGNSSSDLRYWLEVTDDITVASPEITSIKKDGTTVTVKWEDIKAADGYEVWRKVDKGKWENKGEFTARGFEQWWTDYSKTYQFKIRAFIRFGGYNSKIKVYGGWSTVKSLNPTPTNIKLSATTYTYNGKVKTPSVIIKNKLGKTLKKGTDYTVTYAKGRKNVGTYKVKVKFKGSYTGTKTLSFKINPPKSSVSKLAAGKKSLTVSISKKTKQVSGYQIQYATSKKFTKAKTKSIKSYKTTKTALKNLNAKKTYYVRVRTYKIISGKKYYSAWSTVKSKKTK